MALEERLGSEEEYSGIQPWVKIAFSTMIIGLIGYFLTFMLLLISHETFSTFYDSYKWNFILGTGGAIFLLILAITMVGLKGKWVLSILHSPSYSILGKSFGNVYWIKNPIRLLGVSLFASFWVGVFIAIKGAYLSVAPSTHLQISLFASNFFNSGPTALFETLYYFMALSIIASFIISFLYSRGHGKINKNTFVILMVVIFAPLGILIWRSIHLLNYGGQALALNFVLLFGLIQVVTVLLFFSFIPAFSLHYMNNLFLDLAGKFGDFHTILYVIIIGIIVHIFFWLSIRKPRR